MQFLREPASYTRSDLIGGTEIATESLTKLLMTANKALAKQVLIVDDEVQFRGIVRNFVESFGYSCVETDSGFTALELLKESPFSIVIADLAMPEIDGLELARMIKERHVEVDVLIIAADEMGYSPMKIIQAGANDYIPKPFTKEQLEAKLYRIEKERELKERLYSSSITDELTGLNNRRCFYRKLKEEIRRAKRQGYSLSIIMFDLDGFKHFNDQYGHLKGDALLETVGRVLRMSLREWVDSGFRYGGDGFVAILPEADEKKAVSIGDRIKTRFKKTAPGGLTLSMGVAQYHDEIETEAFVHEVDERMYREKKESKRLGETHLEVDLKKDNYYFRCLNCGGLVHWAAAICESCLADPRKRIVVEKGHTADLTQTKQASLAAKDRRKTPRVRVRKTFLHDGFQATIQNLSRDGIQIKTKMHLAVGEALTVAMTLNNAIVRFGGTVIYLKSLSDGNSLAGLRFLHMSPDTRQSLDEFLGSAAPHNLSEQSDR
jgi:diguanylate cyclase (GGDEF)-like protein